MKRHIVPKRRLIEDHYRLFSFWDLVYLSGNFLYRRGLKLAFWTFIGTTSLYVNNLARGRYSNSENSGYEAVRDFLLYVPGPLVGGLVLTGLGLGIRSLPTVVSRGKIAVAEANDLNLMEDLKKQQTREHLEALWNRVYKYESRILYAQSETAEEEASIERHIHAVRSKLLELPENTLRWLGANSHGDLEDIIDSIVHERPVSDKIEKSRHAFMISALYAVCHPLPQTEEEQVIGFDLSAFEDWRDGGYFDISDNKLVEQFSGDVTLMEIKKELGYNKWDDCRQFFGKRLVQGLSYKLVMRAIAVKVGSAVVELNNRYNTYQFNSQAILWPGSEDAKWLDKYEGAREEIYQIRRDVITAVFGHSYQDADVMMDRLFLPNFELATELRARYDPEYCLGKEFGGLEYTVTDDLRAMNCCHDDISGYEMAYVGRAREEIPAFVENVMQHRPDLREDREAIRAVMIAYHINKSGLRDEFLKDGSYESIAPIVDMAVAGKAEFSRRLRALRLHHQLTIFEMEGYRELLKALVYQENL